MSPSRSAATHVPASASKYCVATSLTNEASVEQFFLSPLISDLGYRPADIRPKTSLEELTVARGRTRLHYKPDYALLVRQKVRWIIDAKAPEERLEDWVEQCSGYCLALNRRERDSNPVEFFMLSNGITTRVYKWDQDEPLQELALTDFVDGNAAFERLKQLLARSVLAHAPVQQPGSASTFVIQTVTSEAAKLLFTRCHRIIWKSEGMNPTAAFMEFAKVIFVKLWCDRKLRASPQATAEFEAPGSVHRVPQACVQFSEAWLIQQEASGVVNPLSTVLFANLCRELASEIQHNQKKRIFDEHDSIRLQPETMREVVKRLEHVDLFGIDEDISGRLFETFLSATMRGRDLGQFFTPRSVVRAMVRIADLKASRSGITKVIDACCGSGGFLIEALCTMRDQVQTNGSLSSTEQAQLLRKTANESIAGMDFGKDPPLARIARMNMYLHGDGGSHIYYCDSLDKTVRPVDALDNEQVHDCEELRATLAVGDFDCALTNPPFSMTKERKRLAEAQILDQYELGTITHTSRKRPSLRSSVMFIERYHDLLRPGGFLLSVIDDTVLSSNMFDYFRAYVRKQFLIRGIISLPGDAFRRSGSRVKTSILVLEKKVAETDEQPRTTFYWFAKYLGVDDLAPKASRTDVNDARALAEQETANIAAAYANYLAGATEHTIPSGRLRARLDLKFCADRPGHLRPQWEEQGIRVIHLGDVVTPRQELVTPSDEPTRNFTLIYVDYDGRCQVESSRPGNRIVPRQMYRVHAGDLVFSQIRATDGSIGVCPEGLDGSLVSTVSYLVLSCSSPEDAAYLWQILRSYELRADMQSLSPGSGRYTTRWDVAAGLDIPWLDDNPRMLVGRRILNLWAKEVELEAQRGEIAEAVADFRVNSTESKERFEASRAPK